MKTFERVWLLVLLTIFVVVATSGMGITFKTFNSILATYQKAGETKLNMVRQTQEFVQGLFPEETQEEIQTISKAIIKKVFKGT